MLSFIFLVKCQESFILRDFVKSHEMGHGKHSVQGLAHREDLARGGQRPQGQGWVISESINNGVTLSNRDLCQRAALPGLFEEGHLTLLLTSLFWQLNL